MDMAGAHQSRELAMFLRMMGVSSRPGVPRRPQSQGLTERLIRDIKSSIQTAQSDRRGYSTPWWAAALVAVMVHNHSTLYDTHLSPHELATEPPPGLVSLPACDDSDDESEVADAEGAVNTWLKLHKWVGSAHALLTQLHVFHAGDKVRLYRVIDGRRRVEGPFEVDRRDPNNCYLYFLKGRKFPAPLSHLL
ncbi:hypothetical protein FOZ60_000719 [Perkinsus olseni]|uniref:Integrase catalytic domain-containing protein n=1 Tax=Perkinsus olseni TaxID=32597 RepID=A0A7J6P1N8_PEROL|nr:hypothetical protein FOZ60_000719 [Perkinsus olseni]